LAGKRGRNTTRGAPSIGVRPIKQTCEPPRSMRTYPLDSRPHPHVQGWGRKCTHLSPVDGISGITSGGGAGDEGELLQLDCIRLWICRLQRARSHAGENALSIHNCFVTIKLVAGLILGALGQIHGGDPIPIRTIGAGNFRIRRFTSTGGNHCTRGNESRQLTVWCNRLRLGTTQRKPRSRP